jgi:penicillin amidase
MIEAQEKMDVPSVKAMQMDTHSVLATRMIGVMKTLVRTGNDPFLKEALERVLKWNADIRADIPEPAIYNTWLVRFVYLTYADELGPDLAREYTSQRYISLERFLQFLDQDGVFFDDIYSPEHETPADMATRAFKEALELLAKVTGSRNIDDWSWGKVHHLCFEHVLGKSQALRRLVNRGPYSLQGDGETNLRAHFYETEPPFTATLASGLRLVVAFDPKPKGHMVLITGQNECFFSKHYTDMTKLWRAGGYFCLEEAETRYEMTLQPG